VGGRCSELRPIYQGCRALTFALAGLSCIYFRRVRLAVARVRVSWLAEPGHVVAWRRR